MKAILQHELVKVFKTSNGYEMHICMQNGQWVEHEPFPGDQRGLVAAVSLAAEVLAGKFWLRKALHGKGEELDKPKQVLLSKG
jgi:hypothetical protein